VKIVIAPDSFKGSMTALAAANAMAAGVLRCCPDAEIVTIPLADGGEGTAQTLCDATGGHMCAVTVLDPLCRPIMARYALLGDRETAAIEMAEASGLTLLTLEERNPLVATSFGTGQLIRAALDAGCRRLVIAIGGSATNDGGTGMMTALGAVFRDKTGKELPPGGAALADLAHIDLSGLDVRLKDTEIIAACDVDNPLCGVRGASAVFGPQKGATPYMVTQLNTVLMHYGVVMAGTVGRDIASMPGAGAAGGMGAALAGFLQARMESGAAIVQRETRFVEQIANADLLITGEGQMDAQSLGGKTAYAAACEAKRLGVPAIALCGGLLDVTPAFYDVFRSVFSIVNRPMTLAEAGAAAEALTADAAYRIVRLLFLD